jgi:hypothetical protein
MVYAVQNYKVYFVLHPSSGIYKTKNQNVSETGSVSVLRWMGQRMDRIQNKPYSSVIVYASKLRPPCIKIFSSFNIGTASFLILSHSFDVQNFISAARISVAFCPSYTNFHFGVESKAL